MSSDLPIDLGGGDFLPPLPGGLAPTDQPVTYYFLATFSLEEAGQTYLEYATIRVEGSTADDIYDLALDAQLQARALESSGKIRYLGKLVYLELTAPAYFQYSQGME